MTDRKLAPGAVAVVAGVLGILLLLVAARTDAYWQALLINLGTGVLLFVALEYSLYGAAERVTTMVNVVLRSYAPDERWTEMMSWADSLTGESRQALAHQLQATSPVTDAKLEELELELQWIEQMNATEHTKGVSSVAVLTNYYGVQRVRDVLASFRASGQPTT